MRQLSIILAVVAAVLVCGANVQAVKIDWVTVGDVNNLADSRYEMPGYGGVSYRYLISKYEITNAQYCEFLNAVAATDTHSLYRSDTGGGWDEIKGISRSGSEGSYSYSLRANDPNWAEKPVNYVSWYDALRFANWLHNGQPAGAQDTNTTEDGAYNMSLGANVVRKPDAKFWLPDEDEWYKAAYYKGGSLDAGYWDYATQSDTAPASEAVPGTDMVNGSSNYYDSGYAAGGPYYSTNVGAYHAKPSDSAYGTFDQVGNVWEWNETLIDGVYRGARGGSWDDFAYQLSASYRAYADPTYESYHVGFRVVSLPCEYVLLGDLNSDCKVDLVDFGLMAGNWLIDCRLEPLEPACIPMTVIDNDMDGWDLSVDCDDEDPALNLDDADEDGWTTCDGDCDDSDPDTNPGAPELCDGADNNCNGMVDEGAPWANLGDECTVGMGECEAYGVYICHPSDPVSPAICSATAGAGSPEVCDGLDNDCDGVVDDGNPGGGGACDTGLPGMCANGTLTCQAGALVCVQDISASPEVCDGLDNDCDGMVDEGNPEGGGACDTGLQGVCADGTLTCQGGALVCAQDTMASPELCDGLDNDCDGMVDEGNPGGGSPCNTGLPGVCANGTLTCQGGTLVCVQDTSPSPELCDGLDNDCDGMVDDGSPAAMCPPGSNVVTTGCSSGTCQITGCAVGYGDLDGVFENGCECPPDSFEENNTCSTSFSLGDEHDDDMGDDIVVVGRVSFEGDVDFYRFRAVDDNPTLPTDNFHVTIQFLSNPAGEFRYAVYKGPSCTLPEYDGSGPWEDVGTATVDDTEYYHVKVYRDPGAGSPTCSSYQILMRNE